MTKCYVLPDPMQPAIYAAHKSAMDQTYEVPDPAQPAVYEMMVGRAADADAEYLRLGSGEDGSGEDDEVEI